jgi:hypothetical protein
MSRNAGSRRNATGEPYIYPYSRNGDLEGYQVRFKRQKDRKVESVSQFFGIAAYSTAARAMRAAKRWRQKNSRWMVDPKFKPTYLPRVTGRPRRGVRRTLNGRCG